MSYIASCVDIHSSNPYMSYLAASFTDGNNFARTTGYNSWDYCRGKTIAANVHPIGWRPYLGASSHISGFYLYFDDWTSWDSKAVGSIDDKAV